MRTVKTPSALRLTTDSLAHVFVEVIDEDGQVVRQADNVVTLEVRGARLLGMENGNIGDSSVNGRRQQNSLRVYGGRLVGYIQPDANSQQVVVSATAPFLQPAEVSF